jgi:hypothetical protein
MNESETRAEHIDPAIAAAGSIAHNSNGGGREAGGCYSSSSMP